MDEYLDLVAQTIWYYVGTRNLGWVSPRVSWVPILPALVIFEGATRSKCPSIDKVL